MASDWGDPPGETMRGRRGAPDLGDRANVDRWGDTLRRYQNRGQRAGQNALGANEVRWGDTRTLSVTLTAVGVTAVSDFSSQMIDVRTSARVWGLAHALRWINPETAPAGEQLDADWIEEFGVGSAKTDLFSNLLLVAPPFIPIANAFMPTLPAATIVSAARLRVQTPVAGAFPRTYMARVTSFVAPYYRDGNA